ncbi:MAG: hypothetical protein LAE24_05785 [Candidatus Contendobacter sp.]|jgi:hypothetical protein|nr:hypothetical protein [Candidatus Contendobacter sp.]
MKRRWILMTLLVLAAVGCESRDCERVKTAKGDEICREDAEHLQGLKRPEPDDSANENHSSEARKEE